MRPMQAPSRTIVLLVMVLFAAGCAEAARQTTRTASYPLPDVKKVCATCHADAGAKGAAPLKKGLSELCLDCHKDRVAPAEHKVDIVPSMPVQDLPLSGGKMTCFTCHDPHRNPYGGLLRKPETELCLTCHPY